MRLTYRGINYEPETMPLETTEGEVAGKYRGQSWRYHYPRHIPQLQPKLLLNYRGVSYSKRPVAHHSEMSIPAVTANGELPTPQHFASRKQTEAIEDAHLENMCRKLERRLAVARQRLLTDVQQRYYDKLNGTPENTAGQFQWDDEGGHGD